MGWPVTERVVLAGVNSGSLAETAMGVHDERANTPLSMAASHFRTLCFFIVFFLSLIFCR